MAPSPAAGKQTGGAPKTPTKLNRKPGATPQKLGSSSSKAPSTPKPAGAKKPETDSPSLPSRPKGVDSGKAEETAESAKDQAEDSAAGAKDKAEDAGDEAQSNVEMKDDDDEGPMGKVTEAGDEAQEGLEQAAPEPIDDDEDDAVGGAQDKAEDAADDAGQQAEDVADDATEKAGDVEESADEATDDQDQQQQGGDEDSGLLKGAQGLAGKAQGLAGKSAQDPAAAAKEGADDTKEVAEETTSDAQETAEDGADEAQKVAGETTDEAGDPTEGAQDEAGEAAEGATDEAEETAEGAEVPKDVDDQAGEVAEGAEDEAGETAEGAKDEAGETVEGAEDETKATADGAQDGAGETAEGAEDETKATADGAQDEAGETAEGAKDEAGEAVEGAEGEAKETAEDGEDADVDGAKDDAKDATDDDALGGETKSIPEGMPLDLSVLSGLEVNDDGNVYDSEGNAIGTLAEGDAEDLAGYPIGDEGEILDSDGDLVGRCELLPEEIKKQMSAAKERGDELPEGADEYLDQLNGEEEGEDGEEDGEEDEEESEQGPALPGLAIMDGLTCQIDGLIYDSDGNTVGKVVDGNPEELQNATLNDQGEFIDEDGNVVGHAQIHQDAADLVEQGIYEAEPGVEAADAAADDAVDGEDAPGVEDAAEGAEDAAEGAEDAAGDAVDGAEGAEKGADDMEDELPGIEDQLPGIEALKGLELNDAGEVIGDQGDVLAHIEDEELKQKIADGEIDPATLHIDEEGQVVDEEGNVLGGDIALAEGAAEKLRGGPMLDPRILDGKKVNKKGVVLNEDGETIGELRDGEISDCAGKKVNDRGEVVDKNGEVVGHVNVVPGEAAETATKELLEELGEAPQEAPAPDLPGLDILDGLKVNKKGKILDEDGEEIGELVDGELSECAGKKANEKGEVLDKEGNVIGRVRTLPPAGQEEEVPEEEVPEEEQHQDTPGIEVLDGRKISKKGQVFDDDGEAIAELLDGELSDCAGKKVNEKGEVLDGEGNVIGHVRLLPQEGEEAEEAEEEAPQDNTPGIEVLEGRKVSKSGKVFDDDAEPIGELSDGELSDCVGKKINEKGEVLDNDGNIIGHVTLLNQEPEEEEGEQGPELPPLSVLEGLACNKAGKLVDDNGTVVGELVEGDAKKLAKSGITADNEGQFWDNKGHVIGRAQTVPVEDAEEESPFAGLEGLHVVQDGFVEDEDGNRVGVITEGDPNKLIGRAVDEDGDILDKKGSVVGHAERYEAPAEEEEPAPEEIDLSSLQGKPVNKAGMVIGDEGVPVARLVEGNPKECAGKKLDDQGQIWNDSGKVIGRVEMIPEHEREAKPEGPFAGLEGLRVIEGGKVADEDGNVVGEIVEGNAKRLIGLAVDEDGDIVDKYGNVKGHAEPLPEEEDEAPVDNSLLDGKQLNKQGFVVDENGNPLGRLVEGDAAELAGRYCDENGDIHNDTGKVVGHCEVIPEGERVHRQEGPFAGLEGLRVVKDGWVEDGEGNVVGQLTEGNPKRLVGMSVDEDGDIIDKYGNVKGHADPWQAEDETEVDMSALAGTEINKNGNAVDGNGRIIGRVVEGDVKSMVGKKVDGQGQIWDSAGNVVGRCELVFGEDTAPEGPFAGFEGLQIQKDGTITTPAGDIVGRVIEGDIQKLLGHTPDEDGDIVDKNGNTIGKAERWSPEEKERRANPMSGRRVNSEGEVRDENGDLMGKLTDGDLGHCVGQEIDDAGNVVDVDGNKIGEVTLIENIIEEEYEGPTEEEIAEAQKREEERQVAEKMGNICTQTLEKMQPICKQIKEYMDKADRTPKEELDEEELVNQVKPLIEEGGRILQECNGSLRGLDPDGKIAAQAKGRSGTGEATPEEHRLAETLKELTTTVVTTIDDAKKKLNDMPYAKKKLNPLWGLMTQPLFQILAAVGMLLAGVLGLVGQLLNGLGLGGLVNGLLGGLGIDKLLESFGIGGGSKKKKGKGASALSSLPIVGGMLGGGK
ncbi:hypothetical protein LTR08_000934 [Meristemomyces frigidus]|nr:hypothetical protein LTR08_000934 [Meristemomyces frigidus]